jgi:ABC-type branched-subunit amino acid transport system substrate-binding protein
MPTRRVALALLLAGLLALGCEADDGESPLGITTPKGRPTASATLVIGLVGTMTGPDAWRGEDAFEGADLAVHDLNESLGREEPPYDLVTRDDEGSAEQARRQIEDLLKLPRTVGIVYAGPPGVLPQVEEALAERGLSPHVFQMAPSYVWEARRLAAYALRDRRYATVGLLASSSQAGNTATAALHDALKGAGARRAQVARYASLFDISSGLEGLRAGHVEVLVVEGGPTVISTVLAELRRSGSRYQTTDRARIASAPRATRRARMRTGHWHPQLLGFDLALSPRLKSPPVGMVAAESYSRGVHYLPVPSFRDFKTAFVNWWNFAPLGWQARSYDAVHMIGWAFDRSEAGEDLAAALERMRGERFAGLGITLGPDDHTAVDQASVGLWVVPRAGARVPERKRLSGDLLADFPWVPLARGFSIDGETTDVAPRDWDFLIRRAPPATAPAPPYRRLRFGVTSGRQDPVH